MYDLADGSTTASLSASEIETETALTRDDIDGVLRWLAGEGLVDYEAWDGWIALTHAGIKAVEAQESLAAPPTLEPIMDAAWGRSGPGEGPMSSDERASARQLLGAVRAMLTASLETAEQRERVQVRLDHIEAAIGTSSRLDWILLLLGMLYSFGWTLALEPERVQRIVDLLFSGIPRIGT